MKLSCCNSCASVFFKVKKKGLYTIFSDVDNFKSYSCCRVKTRACVIYFTRSGETEFGHFKCKQAIDTHRPQRPAKYYSSPEKVNEETKRDIIGQRQNIKAKSHGDDVGKSIPEVMCNSPAGSLENEMTKLARGLQRIVRQVERLVFTGKSDETRR